MTLDDMNDLEKTLKMTDICYVLVTSMITENIHAH